MNVLIPSVPEHSQGRHISVDGSTLNPPLPRPHVFVPFTKRYLSPWLVLLGHSAHGSTSPPHSNKSRTPRQCHVLRQRWGWCVILSSGSVSRLRCTLLKLKRLANLETSLRLAVSVRSKSEYPSIFTTLVGIRGGMLNYIANQRHRHDWLTQQRREKRKCRILCVSITSAVILAIIAAVVVAWYLRNNNKKPKGA